MEFKQFVRKPFVVEAIEITAENIAEFAPKIGELKSKVEEDGSVIPYIYVDRRLVPGVVRVYPGYMMTRMGDTIRCYSPKVFKDQFRDPEADPDMIRWVAYMNSTPASTGAESVA